MNKWHKREATSSRIGVSMFALNCMWSVQVVELKLSVRMKLKAASKWRATVVGVAAMICLMLPLSSPSAL